MANLTSSHYVLEDRKVFLAACILSAIGALVFNAFPLFLSATADQFSLDLSEMGLLATTYLGGFALAALVAPAWIILAEWRVSGGIAAIIALAAVAGLGASGDTTFIFAAMGALGAGSGVVFTIGLTILARARDPERAFGIKLMYEMGLAGIVMFIMTKLIITKFGFTGFVVGTFVIYAACLQFIRSLPGNFLRHEATLEKTTAAGAGVGKLPAWVAVAALFIQFAAFSALWGFMERIGADNGIAAETVGTVLTLSIVAGFTGAALAAWLGNRHGHVMPLVFGLLAAVVGAALLAFGHGTAGFVMGACTINAMLQYTVAYQMGLVAHNDHSGRIGVMIPFILASSAAIGPGISGSVAEAQGFAAVYWGFAIVTFLAIALTVWVGRQE